ncbi:MAG TPA: alpha-E domain-containing protein [Hyphomicrobiales bacterium]|nr:alpha-E domain-containing protein [Hyphomicrobiales bacterium]
MLSRTAASLFWLARYVERAENIARILDVAQRMATVPAEIADETNEWESALVAAGCADGFYAGHDKATRRAVINYLAFAEENPSSVRSCLAQARSNARAVRTALTSDMWEAINGAWLELQEMEPSRWSSRELNDFLTWVKEVSVRFDGSAHRTMLRRDTFFFSRVGLYLERADNTARILDVKYHVLLPDPSDVGGGLDYYQWTAILRGVSALTAYHWVYRDSIKPRLIADLLILRPEMPRSLTSCYENIAFFLGRLERVYGRQGEAQRLARSTYTRLLNCRTDDIFQQGLHEFLQSLIAENNRLGAAIAEQYLF